MIGTPLKIKMWNLILKGTAFSTHPVYVSLHTAAPDGTGSNEVTGGAYVRQQAPAANWFINEAGETEIFDITLSFFGMPAATITHAGLWASNGTDFLIGGPLQTPKTTADGDTFQFDGGDLRGIFT